MAEVYLIDANVMMQAANTYYSFDHVPGFWDWLSSKIEDGTIRTASLVADEVDYPAALVDWIDAQEQHGFYIDVSDPQIQTQYAAVAAWVVNEPFGPEHIAKFLNGADPWIIAAAAVSGGTVVTQEQPVGVGSKKVKIPNVCQQFGVACMNTFDLLAELKATF